MLGKKLKQIKKMWDELSQKNVRDEIVTRSKPQG